MTELSAGNRQRCNRRGGRIGAAKARVEFIR
jgi:hypothetical protein